MIVFSYTNENTNSAKDITLFSFMIDKHNQFILTFGVIIYMITLRKKSRLTKKNV